MKLIFFNLCVSPHQMPYVNTLAHHPQVSYVAFVAPYIDIDERIEMGWNSSENMTDSAVNFYIAPSDEQVATLLKTHEGPNTHCIFSGINAFKQVAKWLKMSIQYNVRRAILTEPPMIYEHPLWQHALRFAIQDWPLTRYIDNVFVMGDRFVPYYQMWSKHWRVWPFMYCTELKSTNESITNNQSDKLRLIYVGELCHRKNVSVLLEAIATLPHAAERLTLDVVGDGRDMNKLRAYAQAHCHNVTFHGRQPMNKVSHYIQHADVLVLPSRHDGWGAVVNEALSLGRYVICSDHCGARYLINKLSFWTDELGCGCGQVFRSCDVAHLQEKIEFCINNSDKIAATIPRRIEWSKQTISSSAVAQKMIAILNNETKN